MANSNPSQPININGSIGGSVIGGNVRGNVSSNVDGNVSSSNPKITQVENTTFNQEGATIYGGVAGKNYGWMTTNINQNSDDIARLLVALRNSAQAFPEEQKEEALMELDDLESDLKTPEKQNPKRIGKRCQRLLAAGTAAITLASGAVAVSGDLNELATNAKEFTTTVFELGKMVGVPKESIQLESDSP